MAEALPTPHESILIIYDDGKEKRLPQYDHKPYFVVVKGFGMKPMMLLTSCPVDIYTKESIWRIVEDYLAWWKCDESYRYIKQCYNLEDIRPAELHQYTEYRSACAGSVLF